MKNNGPSGWVLCGALGLALVVGRAWASPPCHCEFYWVMPSDGTYGVPLNSRVFFSWPGLDITDIQLNPVDDTDSPVDFAIEPASSLYYQTWLIPSAPFSPQTAYRLRWHMDTEQTYELTFITGDAADDQAPVLSGASIVGHQLQGACPANRAAEVTFEALSDDHLDRDQLLLHVQASQPQDSYPQSTILPAAYAVFGETDGGECLQNFSGIQTSATYQAAVMALDWSGHASTPASDLTFVFQENPAWEGDGCATGTCAGSPVFSALVLLWLIARNRRSWFQQ